MNKEHEIYLHIYKDSEMGKYTVTKLLENIKDKDNKIKSDVEDILKSYEKFFKEAKECLTADGVKLEQNSIFSKMGASMGIMMEVKSDNSDSSIAEVLIQGISMGSLNMEKKIHDYEKKVDKKEIKFAKDFLKFQESAIDKLKTYL